MARRNVGRLTAAVVQPEIVTTKTHIHSGAKCSPVVRQSVLTEDEPNNPPAVSEDEDDSVPISQLLGKDKAKEVRALGDVTELYVDTDVELPPLFRKGHSNLDKTVAKFFDKVLHFGTVTEVIPKRRGYYYGITYKRWRQRRLR